MLATLSRCCRGWCARPRVESWAMPTPVSFAQGPGTDGQWKFPSTWMAGTDAAALPGTLYRVAGGPADTGLFQRLRRHHLAQSRQRESPRKPWLQASCRVPLGRFQDRPVARRGVLASCLGGTSALSGTPQPPKPPPEQQSLAASYPESGCPNRNKKSGLTGAEVLRVKTLLFQRLGDVVLDVPDKETQPR